MADTTLVADPRTPVGSRPTRRLRSSGRIPAVVYGDGVGPLAVSVEGRELRHALSTAGGPERGALCARGLRGVHGHGA